MKEKQEERQDIILTRKEMMQLKIAAKEMDDIEFLKIFSEGVLKGLNNSEYRTSERASQQLEQIFTNKLCHYAEYGKSDDFINAVNEEKFDVNTPFWYNGTAMTILDYLVKMDSEATSDKHEGQVRIARFLLQKGANVDLNPIWIDHSDEPSPRRIHDKAFAAKNSTSCWYYFFSRPTYGHILKVITEHLEKKEAAEIVDPECREESVINSDSTPDSTTTLNP